MIKAAHDLLSEADAVVHYNGTTFDMPRLNNEFVKLDLGPTPPIHQIDLKKTVMSRFDLISSKLAFVGPDFGIGEKVKNEGWPLWIGCLNGDQSCWNKMRRYNIGDVTLLEKLYYKVQGWIPDHPNMNLYGDEFRSVCVNCGSNRLQKRGLQRALTYNYYRLQCQACKKWMRSVKKMPRASVELR